ncbi:TPA: Abi family protein [Pseudomonas aeruginosa]|uniref:Abi family protein n=2 Tax=Pseudomonas TaxID=286 RepID=UPI00137880CB|nr:MULTISPECIES: Abi family protein [Pseudomonas]EKX2265175.1 Abi family protein [Pseudomonas aeruginosa]EKX3033389.1 Abi family protein [Pseudomonas aeruginosa]EKX3033897.1 Abi family protein [Pseudomonas aeruginosa]EKX3101480.1 Abi family protein [Pseudomonas aeruginosa]EKX3101995.1 Abi family protein [Pseudomonas aeruginosa]
MIKFKAPHQGRQASFMQNHLSSARLATVEAFFQTRTKADLIGCYSWCQAVGASLLPILGDYEVSLRNALHRGLSQYYGTIDSFEWMFKTKPNPAKVSNPNAPDLAWHSMTPRMQGDIEDVADKVRRRSRGRAPTPDDIVSQLSFGFWEHLIAGLVHKAHPADMQRRVLSLAFPQGPAMGTTAHGDRAFVDQLKGLLYQLRDIRNRIGHHDQLWKTAEFDLHGNRGFIPRRPRHTLISLHKFLDRISWMASWIDQEISDHMRNSDHWWTLQALLSQQALAVYRKNEGKAGSFEAVLRLAPCHDVPAWPDMSSGIPERALQLQHRVIVRQFHF